VEVFGYVLIFGGGDNGYVKIADDSHIAPFTLINGQGGVKIGSKVGIGGGTMIYSVMRHPKNTKNIIDYEFILAEVV